MLVLVLVRVEGCTLTPSCHTVVAVDAILILGSILGQRATRPFQALRQACQQLLVFVGKARASRVSVAQPCPDDPWVEQGLFGHRKIDGRAVTLHVLPVIGRQRHILCDGHLDRRVLGKLGLEVVQQRHILGRELPGLEGAGVGVVELNCLAILGVGHAAMVGKLEAQHMLPGDGDGLVELALGHQREHVVDALCQLQDSAGGRIVAHDQLTHSDGLHGAHRAVVHQHGRSCASTFSRTSGAMEEWDDLPAVQLPHGVHQPAEQDEHPILGLRVPSLVVHDFRHVGRRDGAPVVFEVRVGVKIRVEKLGGDHGVGQWLRCPLERVKTVLLAEVDAVAKGEDVAVLFEERELVVVGGRQVLAGQSSVLPRGRQVGPLLPVHLLLRRGVHKLLDLAHRAPGMGLESLVDDGLVHPPVVLAVPLLHGRVQQVQQQLLEGRALGLVDPAEAQGPRAQQRVQVIRKPHVARVQLVDAQASLEGGQHDLLGVEHHLQDLGGAVLRLGVLSGGVGALEGIEHRDGFLLVPLDGLVELPEPKLLARPDVDVRIAVDPEVVEGQAREVVQRRARGVQLPPLAQLLQQDFWVVLLDATCDL